MAAGMLMGELESIPSPQSTFSVNAPGIDRLPTPSHQEHTSELGETTDYKS